MKYQFGDEIGVFGKIVGIYMSAADETIYEINVFGNSIKLTEEDIERCKDIFPVKYGRWVKKKYHMECSICGHWEEVSSFKDSVDSMYEIMVKTHKYCTRCGAIMKA